ncbi:response regulator transcription factor [Aquimarina sp. ERC-38]|uniref:response regulator n=1 Tax=Aquimarina sp. ERC-38 TaxID=2949996 RepID=UPI0022461E78|nr:response regulator transcription factor [Aquimarina sp. ERC-38]UZO80028.1 response regulator transcription factor [Aquimarina sp. ERC-38]
MVSLVLVDDHFLVRDGIRALLEDEDDYRIVGEAANGEEAIRLVASLKPNIVICDIRMPGMSGIETVEQLSQRENGPKTIMLSMHDSDEYILQSVKAGADGYLLKDAGKEEFLKALATVSKGEKYFSGDVSTILIKSLTQGDTPSATNSKNSKTETKKNQLVELTKREREIMDLAISGLSNKEIANQLNISKRTIEVHRFNLMKKMKVKNVLELSHKAKTLGLQVSY